MIELKNKKILLLGLGLHGGGVATACWLYKQGAKGSGAANYLI